MGLTRVEKTMVLDLEQSEMLMNGCPEDLERKMRLKRMWKLIPQVGKKEG